MGRGLGEEELGVDLNAADLGNGGGVSEGGDVGGGEAVESYRGEADGDGRTEAGGENGLEGKEGERKSGEVEGLAGTEASDVR